MIIISAEQGYGLGYDFWVSANKDLELCKLHGPTQKLVVLTLTKY